MRYCDVSFDELEELEQEIHFQEDQEGIINHSKIELYDAMHSHLAVLAEEDEDYRTYYTYIQQKLIDHLLCYGGQMSSIEARQRYTAEKAMEQILAYDAQNPLAAYRLACLLHQQGIHEEAVRLLQIALNSHQDYSQTIYKLNEDQIDRSILLMINSSLKLASRAFVVASGHELVTAEKNSGLAELFTEITANERKLINSAYRFVSDEEETLCSKEHCDAFVSGEPKDTIVLYFSEEGPMLKYNGITEKLAFHHAYLLRHLLSESCSINLITPLHVKNYFFDTHVITGVTKSTYTKAVSELQKVMQEIEIPSMICETEAHGQPAYYFNGTTKYAVIFPVDEEMSLSQLNK